MTELMSDLKYCSKCDKVLNKSCFGLNRTKKDGLQDYCKQCMSNYSKAHHRKRSELDSWHTKLYWGARRASIQRKKKGLNVASVISITPNDILSVYKKQEGLCYWTGLKLDLETKIKWNPRAASLDRLDNSKGYEADNIVLCLWCVNRMRGVMTVEEFKQLIKEMRNGKANSR